LVRFILFHFIDHLKISLLSDIIMTQTTDLEAYIKDLETRMADYSPEKPFAMGIQNDYEETAGFIRTFLEHQGYDIIDLNLLFLNSVYSLKVRSDETFKVLLNQMIHDAQELMDSKPDAKPVLFISNFDLIPYHFWEPVVERARDGIFLDNAQGEKQSVRLMLFTDYSYHYKDLSRYLQGGTYCIYGDCARSNSVVEARHEALVTQMKSWRKEVRDHLPEEEADILQFYLNDLAQRKKIAQQSLEDTRLGEPEQQSNTHNKTSSFMP
jgi:hypothetical protein